MTILKAYRKHGKTGKLIINDNDELEYIGELPLTEASKISNAYSAVVNEIMVNQLLTAYQSFELPAE
jgi:hypothetical protein